MIAYIYIYTFSSFMSYEFCEGNSIAVIYDHLDPFSFRSKIEFFFTIRYYTLLLLKKILRVMKMC